MRLFQVPCFDWAARRGGESWRDCVRAQQPALLRGAPFCVCHHAPPATQQTAGAVRGGGVVCTPRKLLFFNRLSSDQAKPSADDHAWGWARLAQLGKAEAAPATLWPCLLSDARRARFVPCDATKNAFGSFYHVRARARLAARAAAPLSGARTPQEPETEARDMSLAEFCACAADWKSRHLLLVATLAPPPTPGPDGEPPPPPPRKPWQPPPAVPKLTLLAEQLRSLFDWGWLRDRVTTPCGFGGPAACRLLSTAAGALLPARASMVDVLIVQVCATKKKVASIDAFPQLCCTRRVTWLTQRTPPPSPPRQLRGRARVLLLPPQSAYDGVYPYPVAHPHDGITMVDFDAVDSQRWPLAHKLRGLAAVSAPGDVVFVPRGWWAHIESLPGGDGLTAAPQARECTQLHVSMTPGRRARPRAAAEYPLGRRLEEIAADSGAAAPKGAAGARRALLRAAPVAVGDDPPPTIEELHTLAGYYFIRLVDEVYKEVTLTLGRDADVVSFVRKLTDGRMTETPWLNASFREPLLLQYEPKTEKDTRTDAERRFPQLFSRKLQLEGWPVEDTEVSVLNPSHPNFIGKKSAGR